MAEQQSSNAGPVPVRRIPPDRFRLTETDRQELKTRRGLSDEVIAAAHLGSIRVQEDLEDLGADVDIDSLLSLVLIPYLATADGTGAVLYRHHKRSLPDAVYPAYAAPVLHADGPVVLAEAELKALAAVQLGCRAYGLQGIDSHIKRIEELAAQLRADGIEQLVICLDTERPDDAESTGQEWSESTRAALAYALGLERAGFAVRAAELPAQYLLPKFDEQVRQHGLKADIDGALAKGMTAAEFQACLAQAWTFANHPAPAGAKAAAAWQIVGEAGLGDGPVWRAVFHGRPPADIRAGMRELLRRARSAAYLAADKRYDELHLEALAKSIQKLIAPYLGKVALPEIRRELKHGARDLDPGRELGLEDFGLREVPNGIVRFRASGQGEQCELVANFQVLAIRTGTARFLLGRAEPCHEIVVTTGEQQRLEISGLGDPHDARLYVTAGDGRLTVPDPKLFRGYIAYKINRERIQEQDASVDRRYVVGSYLNDAGELVPSDNVQFPYGREECHYDGHIFATDGRKEVFAEIAKLQANDSVVIILVWVLGSPLKPVLGPAYPHLEATGDSGVGKDTTSTLLQERFGLVCLAGPTEFGTLYRSKKAVANTVLPVQVQELGRLRADAQRNLVEAANLAYNVQPTSHGHLDKRFVLAAPLLLWGQDSFIEDVALQGKLLRVELSVDAKDPAALALVYRHPEPWPMRSWVDHLCIWANARNIGQVVAEKAEWLRSQLAPELHSASSNADRTIWNYAILLVTQDALQAFGVPVNIAGTVVKLARQHLEGMKRDGGSVARQVLQDLLLELQRPDRSGAYVHKLDSTGLYLKPENALSELRRRGHMYDISSPRTLTHMLVQEKLGTASVPLRVGGAQSRYFHIPADVLKEFDFEVLGAPAAPAGEEPAAEGDPLAEL